MLFDNISRGKRTDEIVGNKVKYTKNGQEFYRELPGRGKKRIAKGRRRMGQVASPSSKKLEIDVSETKKITPKSKSQKKGSPPIPIPKNGQQVARAVGLGVLGTAIASSVIGGSVVARDNEGNKQKEHKLRVPENNKPDAQTLKTYESFEPGDMIYREFSVPGIGIKQHYSIYMGKDEKGNHIHLGSVTDKGSDGKSRTRWGISGLTQEDEAKNLGTSSDFAVVPESMRNKKSKRTKQEVFKMAQRLGKLDFDADYDGMVSNCESFARAVVEGDATSYQSKNYTGFSKKVMGDFFRGINMSTTKTYGKRRSAKEINDALNSQNWQAELEKLKHDNGSKKSKRKDAIEKTSKNTGTEDYGVEFIYKLADKDKSQFSQKIGLPHPKYFERGVNVYLQSLTGTGRKEAQIQLYKVYLLILTDIINRGRNKEVDRTDSETDIANLVEKDTVSSQSILKKKLDTLIRLASNCDSFEELEKKSSLLFTAIKSSGIEKKLRQGIAIAKGIGYSDVIEETKLNF